MKHTINKPLILSLIKDDLIHTKLITGLNELGLNANNYSLHLSDTIFKLMGYEDDEEAEDVFRTYLELIKHAARTDISETNASFNALALEIYEYLLSQKAHE